MVLGRFGRRAAGFSWFWGRLTSRGAASSSSLLHVSWPGGQREAEGNQDGTSCHGRLGLAVGVGAVLRWMSMGGRSVAVLSYNSISGGYLRNNLIFK